MAIVERLTKVFDAEITLINTETDTTLLPGMTTTCKIITEKIEHTYFIPIQSVFTEEDRSFVYDGDSFEKIYIETGMKNDSYIVVIDGLEPGQKITLRDPYKKLETIGTEETEEIKT